MSDDISESAGKNDDAKAKKRSDKDESKPDATKPVREIGGRDGPDPTRYGDWEKAGRCIDF